MYAEIVFPIALESKFLYYIPHNLIDRISIYKRVKVNFNKTIKTGYVVNLLDKIDNKIKTEIKPILKIIDEKVILTDELFKIGLWLSNNYYCSLGEALDCIFPTDLVPLKTKKITAEQLTLLEFKQTDKNLSKIDFKNYNTFVITNSDNEQIIETYIKLISKAIQSSVETIFLVPEIWFTTYIFDILKKYFGNSIILWHSKIPNKEKYKNWFLIKEGKTKVVFGTRSSIFVPFKNLKLIIIHNYEDESYRQINKPEYNAIDVAQYRAKISNSNIVLGSTICSINTYYKLKIKEYRSIKILQKNIIPKIKIVDLSKKENSYNFKLYYFSTELINSIKNRILKKEISIIFLNKLGHSRIIKCNTCQTVIKCPKCDISLIYHQYSNSFKCHYCGYEQPSSMKCKICGCQKFKYISSGIEKLYSDLTDIFPNVKIIRFDTDTIKKESDIQRTISEIINNKYNIIIGTQFLLHLVPYIKKSDIKITLLTLFNIDNILYFPEYKSSENVFYLITQLKDLLNQPGELLIQTFNQEHFIFKYLQNFDWKKFYNKELKYRKQLYYPPYSKIINITMYSKNEQNTIKEINNLISFINTKIKSENIHILGPVKTYIYKLKGYFHQQIVIKLIPELVPELINLIKKFFIKKYRLYIKVKVE